MSRRPAAFRAQQEQAGSALQEEATLRGLLILTAAAALFLHGLAAAGTVVRFDTSLGSFDVELYDNVTPLTVAGWLEETPWEKEVAAHADEEPRSKKVRKIRRVR